MLAYTSRHIRRIIKIDFIRFCIVGGSGFIINVLLLILLDRVIGLNVFLAQIISAEVALFSNFILHNHWTYKSHEVAKSPMKLIIQFHATTWPAIIGSALMVTAGEKILHLSNIFALMLSSAIALAWNFVWSKYVIWRDVNKSQINRIVS